MTATGYRLAGESVGVAYMRPVCHERGGPHICGPYNRNGNDAGMTTVVDSDQ